MFKKQPEKADSIVLKCLFYNGLETPLLQRRLLNAWEKVVGESVNRYTKEKTIRNQTLFVKIENPALRQDLSMMQQKLVQRLNAEVGSLIITNIRFI